MSAKRWSFVYKVEFVHPLTDGAKPSARIVGVEVAKTTSKNAFLLVTASAFNYTRRVSLESVGRTEEEAIELAIADMERDLKGSERATARIRARLELLNKGKLPVELLRGERR